MPRIITERTFDLRTWQQEAFRSVMDAVKSGRRDFLCVATPGAGKTKFALTVAHKFLQKNLCERVVIVTPTESLKEQWASEAANFAGLDIDPDFKNDMGCEAVDYHGVAITYALLGQDKNQAQTQNTFRRKTLVIFDEIHHAGDNLSWGNAIKLAFEQSVFRLAISGTAFRSDDNPIPFINYDKRVSVADYTYSYERAIKENVCRPVYFCIYDGKMKWKVAEEEFEHSFTDYLTPDQVSKRLKTALDPKGNWVREVIRAADQKLTDIRHSHPAAAGMVFASTQKHAKELASVVEKITGVKPPVIVSEDSDSSAKLEQFKKGSSRWLISVKMVSEGVDIPRLRVGVYFTNVKAELFFRQAVGRFVRVLKDLLYQDAFIFIPQDREVVKLAENIQVERDHALDEAERPGNNGFDGPQTDLFGSDYIPALQGKFVPLGSEATENKTIAINVELSSGAKHSVDHRVAFEDAPVYLQKQLLRERLNSLAKRIALQKGNGKVSKPDFKFAHSEWRRNGGREMELETVDELQKRLKFYQNLLRSN